MAHAFVTGGSGFIGTNLLKLLCQKDYTITALYHTHTNKEALGDLPIRWVQADLDCKTSLIKAIPKHTDVIFHLAGDTNLWSKLNARQTAVNVQGTENMIGAAIENKVDVFVHTSSVAAWGNVSGKITEQQEQHGCQSWINYEHTKWMAERKALNGLNEGLKVVILNPANVVGPHDQHNWGRLLIALAHHKLPFIAEGCISVAHVRDVVDAHITAAKQGKAGHRYILGGRHLHFTDFIACANRVLATHNMPKVIPVALFRAYARVSSAINAMMNRTPPLTPELAHFMTRKKVHYSSSKAVSELGYKIAPMEVSVQDCARWLQSEGLI